MSVIISLEEKSRDETKRRLNSFNCLLFCQPIDQQYEANYIKKESKKLNIFSEISNIKKITLEEDLSDIDTQCDSLYNTCEKFSPLSNEDQKRCSIYSLMKSPLKSREIKKTKITDILIKNWKAKIEFNQFKVKMKMQLLMRHRSEGITEISS
jgi:hypothetical protein